VRVLSATTLTIVKATIPAAQTASRYSVHIDGTSNNVHNNLDIGVGQTQSQTVTIQTGTYRVIERPVPAGYAAIYSEGCNGILTGEPASDRTCSITNVAITQNTGSSAGLRGLSIAPIAQQCLQNPSCFEPLGIPSSLIHCLQNPDCFRTLNLDTSTGMSIQHNVTKKDIISVENKKNTNETGKLVNQSSAVAFNQTKVTSTKGITIKK
jgi:hypothetical protein